MDGQADSRAKRARQIQRQTDGQARWDSWDSMMEDDGTDGWIKSEDWGG